LVQVVILPVQVVEQQLITLQEVLAPNITGCACIREDMLVDIALISMAVMIGGCLLLMVMDGGMILVDD
jgi:hypothetical protein